MLVRPILARCSDRTQHPQHHPTSGSPEDWLREEHLVERKFFGLSFDFFVNWTSKPIILTPTIWIKRILGEKYSYQNVIDDLEPSIRAEFNDDYLDRLTSFAHKHSLIVKIIIFRDDNNWADAASELLIISIKQEHAGHIEFNHSLLSISDFKYEIQANSGGPIQVGAKGLIYGTSRLECHLSTTSSLYPGDVDLILIDEQNKVRAILEFKKHTKLGPISGQKLSNYYAAVDRRKYDRIAILRDYLDTDVSGIPIIIIYYPTQVAITQLKIELIGGPIGKLEEKASFMINLPLDQTKETVMPIVDKILDGIPEFQKYK